jgi:adenine-specific DNA-methyltransferase
MERWNIGNPDVWAALLGMLKVPVFDTQDAKRPEGDPSLLLDGSRGSFLLSTAITPSIGSELDLLGLAWSANVRHSVVIDASEGRALVRRWDAPDDVTTWRIRGAQDAVELSRLFKRSEPEPKGHSVIDRGLKTFRDIRRAIEQESGTALDVVLAFNTVLAWVASTHSDREIEFDEAVRILNGIGAINFAPERISRQLHRYPLGSLAQLLREGDSRASTYLLDANVLIRHASGPLYQEAHKQLIEPGAWQSDLFPTLIPSEEYPHAPAPSFVHHTPPVLARALVELAMRFIDLDRLDGPLDILDPATGSGIFLIEAAREIGIQTRLPRTLHLRGFDQSELAVAMADFCVRKANQTRSDQTVTVRQADSLMISDWGAPSIIAMNPPFKAWENLDDEARHLVQQTLGSLYTGKPDLAFAFIVRAMRSLKLGGVVASLMPPSFLDGDAARPIREYISRSDEFHVRLIGHLHDFSYFDATVEPSFIVVERSSQRAPIELVTAKSGAADEAIASLRRRELISAPGYELYSITSDELPTDRWVLQPQRSLRFIEMLKAHTSQIVSDFFDSKLGIRTGNNPIFIVSQDEIDRLCPTGAERRFFRPIADRIEAGRIQPSGYIFYPYDTKGTLLLGTEKDLKDKIPKFYSARLRPNESILKDRKSRYREWWEMSEPRVTWLPARKPRIISKSFGAKGNFALDANGEYAIVQGLAWRWKRGEPTADTLLAYLALLNSSLFDQILSCFCPRVRGGQYNLSTRYVRRVPLPSLVDSDLRNALSEIGRAIAEGTDYDNQVQDRLVSQAYGLSPGESRLWAEEWERDVDSLMDEVDEDGYIFRPTEGALGRARDLLRSAYGPLAARIPRPFISPTGSGGIRIEWTSGVRVVSLVLSDRLSYIHHMAGDEHDAETDVSEDTLVRWLRWLIATP